VNTPFRFDRKFGIIYDAKGVFVGAVKSGSNHVGPLFAAAPDLQAAGREMVAAIERELAASAEFFALISNKLEPELTGLRAALKKADGK
jgi:hypothetical protein